MILNKWMRDNNKDTIMLKLSKSQIARFSTQFRVKESFKLLFVL